MSWKKAVFYGGAVLVLAACGDATSPNSPSALTKVNGVPASLVKKADATSDSTSTPTTVPTAVCSQIVIHAGLDGSLVEVCVPTMW